MRQSTYLMHSAENIAVFRCPWNVSFSSTFDLTALIKKFVPLVFHCIQDHWTYCAVNLNCMLSLAHVAVKPDQIMSKTICHICRFFLRPSRISCLHYFLVQYIIRLLVCCCSVFLMCIFYYIWIAEHTTFLNKIAQLKLCYSITMCNYGNRTCQ